MNAEHPNFPIPKQDPNAITKEALRTRITEHLDKYVLVGFDEHGTSVIIGRIPDEQSRVALNRLIVRGIIPPNFTGNL